MLLRAVSSDDSDDDMPSHVEHPTSSMAKVAEGNERRSPTPTTTTSKKNGGGAGIDSDRQKALAFQQQSQAFLADDDEDEDDDLDDILSATPVSGVYDWCNNDDPRAATSSRTPTKSVCSKSPASRNKKDDDDDDDDDESESSDEEEEEVETMEFSSDDDVKLVVEPPPKKAKPGGARKSVSKGKATTTTAATGGGNAKASTAKSANDHDDDSEDEEEEDPDNEEAVYDWCAMDTDESNPIAAPTGGATAGKAETKSRSTSPAPKNKTTRDEAFKKESTAFFDSDHEGTVDDDDDDDGSADEAEAVYDWSLETDDAGDHEGPTAANTATTTTAATTTKVLQQTQPSPARQLISPTTTTAPPTVPTGPPVSSPSSPNKPILNVTIPTRQMPRGVHTPSQGVSPNWDPESHSPVRSQIPGQTKPIMLSMSGMNTPGSMRNLGPRPNARPPALR